VRVVSTLRSIDLPRGPVIVVSRSTVWPASGTVNDQHTIPSNDDLTSAFIMTPPTCLPDFTSSLQICAVQST